VSRWWRRPKGRDVAALGLARTDVRGYGVGGGWELLIYGQAVTKRVQAPFLGLSAAIISVPLAVALGELVFSGSG